MVKETPSCLAALCTTLTNMKVVFPLDSNVSMRILLIAAAILIDYQYFEEKENNVDGAI